MACLIAELVMLVLGIIALARGQIRIASRRTIYGTRARLAALFLILPFPLNFGASIVLALILVAQRKEPTTASVQPAAAILEIAIFVLCMAAALIITLTAAEPSRSRGGLDDDFDDFVPPRRARRRQDDDLPLPDDRFEEDRPRRGPRDNFDTRRSESESSE